MRRILELREAYRRADLRLRGVLFGDAHSPSGLRSEEARQRASVELRRMRRSFDDLAEVADEQSMSDELRLRASRARDSEDSAREPR